MKYFISILKSSVCCNAYEVYESKCILSYHMLYLILLKIIQYNVTGKRIAIKFFLFLLLDFANRKVIILGSIFNMFVYFLGVVCVQPWTTLDQRFL